MRGVMFKVSAVLVSLISLTVLAADLPPWIRQSSERSQTAATGVREPKELARWSGLPSWATSVAFSADDKTLAIGLKGQVQLADVETKSLASTINLKSGQVRSLAFSPDGQLIATGSYQNVTLFNAATGETLREFKGHRGNVLGLAFSPDGQRLATACDDELARVWTLQGEEPPILLKGHSYPVTGVAWSPDGTLVATSAGDDTRPTKPGQVRIWDSVSGALKHHFELHKKAATSVAFSPDGHFLLSSSVDERVNVYDLINNKPLGFFAGHSRPTNAVVVHPDGETAISISGGRAVGKNELIAWEFEIGRNGRHDRSRTKRRSPHWRCPTTAALLQPEARINRSRYGIWPFWPSVCPKSPPATPLPPMRRPPFKSPTANQTAARSSRRRTEGQSLASRHYRARYVARPGVYENVERESARRRSGRVFASSPRIPREAPTSNRALSGFPHTPKRSKRWASRSSIRSTNY